MTWLALFGEVPTADFVMRRRLWKLSKSFSLASPSPFFCDTSPPPPFAPRFWTRPPPLTLLWGVHSPSPRSVTRLRSGLWDEPLFFLFLSFFFRSPLTVLQVHRGLLLAHRGVRFFHDAAPFCSRTRGATSQPPGAFFYLFHIPILLVPCHVSHPVSLALNLPL